MLTARNGRKIYIKSNDIGIVTSVKLVNEWITNVHLTNGKIIKVKERPEEVINKMKENR